MEDVLREQLAYYPFVMTAGAYVWCGGVWPFVIGPHKAGDRLAVVRLGGHREAGESAWQCAAREVREEATLVICPLPPPATYWLRSTEPPTRLRLGTWPLQTRTEVAPLLVVENAHLPTATLSVMYLAHSDRPPVPAGETRGLLLLRPREVQRIVAGGLTLDQYLAMGGKGLLRQPLPGALPLEPFLQLRVLAELLHRHPDLAVGCDPLEQGH